MFSKQCKWKGFAMGKSEQKRIRIWTRWQLTFWHHLCPNSVARNKSKPARKSQFWFDKQKASDVLWKGRQGFQARNQACMWQQWTHFVVASWTNPSQFVPGFPVRMAWQSPTNQCFSYVMSYTMFPMKPLEHKTGTKSRNVDKLGSCGL